MDFLKNNYEKVLLGLVLLGLAVALGFLPFKISSEKTNLADARDKLIQRPVKPLTNIDLTVPEGAAKRVAASFSMDLTTTNKVFNPMPWQRAADQHLLKVGEQNVGPRAVTILKTTPLYLTLTLDSVSVVEAGPKYIIGVQKEAAPVASQRTKKEVSCSLNVKSDFLIVREVKGKPEDPAQVIVELTDTGDRATITKETPYKRVDGYTADLKYPPENKSWTGRRIGSPVLTFAGEDYNIVAITQNEVVLSAKSNQKKWTITSNPVPTTSNPVPTTSNPVPTTTTTP